MQKVGIICVLVGNIQNHEAIYLGTVANVSNYGNPTIGPWPFSIVSTTESHRWNYLSYIKTAHGCVFAVSSHRQPMKRECLQALAQETPGFKGLSYHFLSPGAWCGLLNIPRTAGAQKCGNTCFLGRWWKLNKVMSLKCPAKNSLELLLVEISGNVAASWLT